VRSGRFLGLTGCGLVLLLLTAAGLYTQAANRIGWFVLLALSQCGVYAASVWLIAAKPAIPAQAGSERHKGPRHWPEGNRAGPLFLILAVAAAMRIAVLAAPPFLSTDIYRYVWDGRVIAAGINPYRYIPADPALAPLRDDAIFPHINRNTYAPTVYPPAAEAIFYAATRLGETVTAMKAAMVAFEAFASLLLLSLLGAAALPRSRILIYAWHPLPLWEFAGSGHIDAAIVALAALALWAASPKASSLRGAALALATLVKFYPVVIFPALWRRRNWRMPLAFAAVVVLAYLPVIGVGWEVFGFLPGYLAEEGFAGGAGFYPWSAAQALLPLHGVPTLVYLAVAALLLAPLGVAVAFRRIAAPAGTALLAGAFTLLLSPHYPWYFAWLLLFATLMPTASLLWLTSASFLLYLAPVGSQLVRDWQRFAVETALYAPFLVLAAIDIWRYWRRTEREDRDPGG